MTILIQPRARIRTWIIPRICVFIYH